jgi:hypothetical protein
MRKLICVIAVVGLAFASPATEARYHRSPRSHHSYRSPHSPRSHRHSHHRHQHAHHLRHTHRCARAPQRYAPVLSVAGQMLRWTRAGSGGYRIFENPPGRSIHVTGTTYTPRPQPGVAVRYRVKATRKHSRWSNEVTIRYGASGAALTNYLTPPLSLPPNAELPHPPSTSTPPPLGIPGTWTLRFNDEFDESQLNPTIWTSGLYRSENYPLSNICQSPSLAQEPGDGLLHLKLIKETTSCVTGASEYTGSVVETDPTVAGKVGFQYTFGVAEWRAYYPASAGQTVANWPLVQSMGQLPWPQNGENDTAEGQGGGLVCFHFHSSAGGLGDCPSGDYSGWHTYASEWEPGKVAYYYDGKRVGEITLGITDKPMFLIMSLGCGFPGGACVAPSEILIDYARVWQASPAPKQTSVLEAASAARPRCSLRPHEGALIGDRRHTPNHRGRCHRGRGGAAGPRACRKRQNVARPSKLA